jgi:hypothetical protein
MKSAREERGLAVSQVAKLDPVTSPRHVNQFHVIQKRPRQPVSGGGGEVEDHRHRHGVVRRAVRGGYGGAAVVPDGLPLRQRL